MSESTLLDVSCCVLLIGSDYVRIVVRVSVRVRVTSVQQLPVARCAHAPPSLHHQRGEGEGQWWGVWHHGHPPGFVFDLLVPPALLQGRTCGEVCVRLSLSVCVCVCVSE